MNIEEKRNQIEQESNFNKPLNANLENNLMDDCSKNTVLKTLALTLIIAVITFMTGCSTPADKVENSQNDVIEAEHDLEKANAQYSKDVKNYRKKSRERINANNERIIELKSYSKKMDKKDRVKYEEKIDKLETKNDNLEERLDDYEAENEDNWESFKAEFNNDMDELGSALKSFTTDNK
ncbi:MAG: hypothetical protein WED10_05875 [Brumimicrobium sp.]